MATATARTTGAGRTTAAAPATLARTAGVRCLWCGREVAQGSTVGRRRRYCGQSCRQRAYEDRAALQRGGLPEDAVMLTADERESLSDRLFQVRCAAEDIATAVSEGADPGELGPMVEHLLAVAREAEVLR